MCKLNKYSEFVYFYWHYSFTSVVRLIRLKVTKFAREITDNMGKIHEERKSSKNHH